MYSESGVNSGVNGTEAGSGHNPKVHPSSNMVAQFHSSGEWGWEAIGLWSSGGRARARGGGTVDAMLLVHRSVSTIKHTIICKTSNDALYR